MAYVKFFKGTTDAFKALGTKDSNALYFITNEDGSEGRLYLGAVPIVCDSVKKDELVTKLTDLNDISLPTPLEDEHLLTYDTANEKWTASHIEDLLVSILNTRVLTLDTNNNLTLVGFAEAEAGSSPVIGTNGQLTWVKPDTTTVEGLSQAIESLEKNIQDLTTNKADVTNVYTKQETLTEIQKAIQDVDHLSRKLVDSYDSIDPAAADADRYIYMVPETDGTYKEYMVIGGKVELIGSSNINLDDYVQKEEGSRLITQVEIAKLNAIEEGAQKNLFSKVSADFLIVDDTLTLSTEFKNNFTNISNIVLGYTDENEVEHLGLAEEVALLKTTVGSLNDTYVTKNTFDTTIEDIYTILSWQSLE